MAQIMISRATLSGSGPDTDGSGESTVADMAGLLAGRSNQETSPPAPPEGLYFVAAAYDRRDYALTPEDEPT